MAKLIMQSTMTDMVLQVWSRSCIDCHLVARWWTIEIHSGNRLVPVTDTPRHKDFKTWHSLSTTIKVGKKIKGEKGVAISQKIATQTKRKSSNLLSAGVHCKKNSQIRISHSEHRISHGIDCVTIPEQCWDPNDSTLWAGSLLKAARHISSIPFQRADS